MNAVSVGIGLIASLILLAGNAGLAQDRGYLTPAEKPAKKPTVAVTSGHRSQPSSTNSYTEPIRRGFREQLGLFGKTSGWSIVNAHQKRSQPGADALAKYSAPYANPLSNYTGAGVTTELFAFWTRDYTSDLPKQQVAPITSPDALFKQPYSLSNITGPEGAKAPYAGLPQWDGGLSKPFAEDGPGKPAEEGGAKDGDNALGTNAASPNAGVPAAPSSN